MRTFELLPNGVGRELNVFLAKETRHFQHIGLPQSEVCLALWTPGFLADIARVEPDMHAAGRTRHFQQLRGFCPSPLQPEPDQPGIAAGEQVHRQSSRNPTRRAARQEQRVGEAANASALRMTVGGQRANPVRRVIRGQPRQPTQLQPRSFAKQTNQRHRQLQHPHRQHGRAQRNPEHGFGQGQNLRVPGRHDKPFQSRRQQDAAGRVDEHFGGLHGWQILLTNMTAAGNTNG